MTARLSRTLASAAAASLLSMPFAVGPALATGSAGPATAIQLGQYNVTAAAQGAQLLITVPDFLVVESAQVAVPAAQAGVSSVTGSNGFASVPYPGQDIVSLPETVNGLTGLPLPAYPLYVGTSYPSKLTAKAVGPVYSMHSTSSRLASVANGSGGASAGPLNLGSLKAAASARETADGTAVATSNSDVYGIDIAGVLRIGEVHATASATQKPSGKLIRSSTLDVGETTIAGVGIDLTPQGLRIGSAKIPISVDNPLSRLLSKQHITLQYVAPRNTKHGVISAGVAITIVHTFPKSFPDLGGVRATLSFLLGSASASAQTAGQPTSLGTGSGGGGGAGGGTAPDSSGGSTATTGNVGGAGAGGGAIPPPLAGGSQGSTGGQSPQVSGTPGTTRTVTVASTAPFGVRGVYLYLVLAAAMILVGGTLWRLFGVRILWT
jgi:hypothetical protein